MSGLKSNADWETMGYLERAEWLDQLRPDELWAQAQIRARATERPADQVLTAWVHNGYITAATRGAAQAAGRRGGR